MAAWAANFIVVKAANEQIPPVTFAFDSALLIATTPVITALLAVRSGADTLTPAKLGGSLLSFGGVALIVASGAGLAFGAALIGDLLTLVAAVCWSVYTAFGAPILRRHSPLRTTTWAMTGGSIVLAVPGLAQAVGVEWPSVQPDAWAGLVAGSVARDADPGHVRRSAV